ncbi:hypothetical protein [Moorena sp. SIO3A2]|uniref:hypothetical protein n=1 Tax=Moorena sp. SIO3A2 TaxID=2607841 RepID=UPI0013B6797F|nr:hypothetical protein [Moorena sp. SIO3A2]NER90326.1 hypothetical protein [Moorena sp. SIO3A2]
MPKFVLSNKSRQDIQAVRECQEWTRWALIERPPEEMEIEREDLTVEWNCSWCSEDKNHYLPITYVRVFEEPGVGVFTMTPKSRRAHYLLCFDQWYQEWQDDTEPETCVVGSTSSETLERTYVQVDGPTPEQHTFTYQLISA